MWQEYQGQGVTFISIAYKDTEGKARAFLDEFGITYPNAFDPANKVARAYRVQGVPETFFIKGGGDRQPPHQPSDRRPTRDPHREAVGLIDCGRVWGYFNYGYTDQAKAAASQTLSTPPCGFVFTPFGSWRLSPDVRRP